MKTKRIKGRLFSMEVIEDAIRVASEYFKVELTVDQMIEVIAGDDTLARDLKASGGASDTVTRDYLVNALTTMTIGKAMRDVLANKGFGWPVNGDSNEYAALFYDAFFAAAKEKGWKVRTTENA